MENFNNLINNSSFWLLLFAFVIIVILIIRLRSASKKQEIIMSRFHDLETKFNEIQLENLDARLNPHLFKNILNSVQSHAYQTYIALDKLANVLDYILYESRNKFVTPSQEVNFALNLIEINKIKLSPLFELKVKLKINENEPLYHQPLLAPFISTDLIENAFKHADLQSTDAFISIIFEFHDSTFTLTVANRISEKRAIQKKNSGFGIDALKQRLQIIYQDHFKFETFTEDNVYIANLKINLLEYKAKMLAAGR